MDASETRAWVYLLDREMTVPVEASLGRIDRIRTKFTQLFEFQETFLSAFIEEVSLELKIGTDALPRGLTEEIESALRKGPGDVYLTQGRVLGEPAFIIIYHPPGGQGLISGQVLLEPDRWQADELKSWPQSGAAEARAWKVARQ
ncbi:hypothetical protein [Acrocarpospora sp. B8E8]|uniref:hypothetical protein n=1 Tax=Acrocarpospora sp. B8E8 TaxID=3153572 RepID=UPI00325EC16B